MEDFYVNVYIVGLIALFIGSLAILFWIFRPNSRKLYEKYAKIPLKEKKTDEQNKESKQGK